MRGTGWPALFCPHYFPQVVTCHPSLLSPGLARFLPHLRCPYFCEFAKVYSFINNNAPPPPLESAGGLLGALARINPEASFLASTVVCNNMEYT